jgi:hypothetical protein
MDAKMSAGALQKSFQVSMLTFGDFCLVYLAVVGGRA